MSSSGTSLFHRIVCSGTWFKHEYNLTSEIRSKSIAQADTINYDYLASCGAHAASYAMVTGGGELPR
jgi:hypothetical protein